VSLSGVARHYCHALSALPQGDAVRLSSGMAHSGFEVIMTDCLQAMLCHILNLDYIDSFRLMLHQYDHAIPMTQKATTFTV
jgi:hypothetical protein